MKLFDEECFPVVKENHELLNAMVPFAKLDILYVSQCVHFRQVVLSVGNVSQNLRYWLIYMNQPIRIQRYQSANLIREIWRIHSNLAFKSFLTGSLESITSWERFLEVVKVPYRGNFLPRKLPTVETSWEDSPRKTPLHNLHSGHQIK